jgi:hypothetical protein
MGSSMKPRSLSMNGSSNGTNIQLSNKKSSPRQSGNSSNIYNNSFQEFNQGISGTRGSGENKNQDLKEFNTLSFNKKNVSHLRSSLDSNQFPNVDDDQLGMSLQSV